MNISIHLAKQNDWNQLVGIYKREGADDQVELVERDAKKEFLEIGTSRIIWFAEVDSEVVGAVQLVLNSTQQDLADNKEIAMVHHFRVSKNYQKKGIGKKLYEALEQEAKDRGIKKLTLEVDKDNPYAQDIYKNWGYEYLREGKDPIEIVMIKSLFT
jgi:ribosomal protein S18 acetylase RimI-like enzyme